MKDNWGDPVTVEVEDDHVNLFVSDAFDRVIAELSPAKARKLAKKLRHAADDVDGGRTVRYDSTEDFLKSLEPLYTLPLYTLSLTEDQAKTLRVILGRIGGTAGQLNTPVSARKYADQIATALREVGFGWDADDEDPRFAIDEHDRAIYFVGVAE